MRHLSLNHMQDDVEALDRKAEVFLIECIDAALASF